MNVGAKIKFLREKSKLSISKLASGAGISQSYLGEVEAGIKNITVSKLKDICDYLGVSLRDFFSDDDEQIKMSLTKRQAVQKIALLGEKEANVILELINLLLSKKNKI